MVSCNVQRGVYAEFGDFAAHQLLMFVWQWGRPAPNEAVYLSFQTSVISATFTTTVKQYIVVVICQGDPEVGFKCFWKQNNYMICLSECNFVSKINCQTNLEMHIVTAASSLSTPTPLNKKEAMFSTSLLSLFVFRISACLSASLLNNVWADFYEMISCQYTSNMIQGTIDYILWEF